MSDIEYKKFLVEQCRVTAEYADRLIEWEAELERKEMDRKYRQMNRKWMNEMFDDEG